MTVAVIVATAAGRGGPEPAAALPYGDATVLDGLCDRLATLNVPDLHVLARPESATALRTPGAEVTETPGPADELRAVAAVAREAARAERPVLVLPGDLAVGEELLRRLVHDGDCTAALVAPPATAPPCGYAVRTRHGRVVAAASATHRVNGPDAQFPGALRVAAGAVPLLAETAERLAALMEDDTALLPAQDPLPLLLVGLVRAGVPVLARGTGPLPVRRPGSEFEARVAHTAVTGADEDSARLVAAVKTGDGPFATYAVSRYSLRLVRWARRRGLTPNMVTLISLGLAAVAAFWFAAGTRVGMVAGAVLFFLAFALDCVDGQLARYTRRFSVLGSWLDAMADRVKEWGVYAGLAVGSLAAAGASLVHAGNVWPLAVAALAVLAVRHMIAFAWDARGRTAPPPRACSLTDPGDLGVSLPERRTPRDRAVYWAHRLAALPIGERTALIAVTAALANAAVTFWSLIGWGCLAAVVTLTTRLARSVRTARP
ncbi:CDP-alcohol phosphatidyltransferase family protein [Actinomadura flavalba]|uniref:CDP-alcohol phosphatidyltransferase family protein n=1 Tax=Actinomadura flavalba TaxID=1120938 RepID=UPI0003A8399C|nr:CDP-alcohol phosphatidyltransferase family protein [Actinomadura flavalba]